jgi:DNA polymerase III delta prime subunit
MALLVAGCGDSSSSIEAATAARVTCDVQANTAVVEAARVNGLIRGMDVTAEDGVVIVVSAAAWRRMSLDQQKSMAAAVDCAIAGQKHLREIHFRQDRDGEDLLRVYAYELLNLRSAHYAR